MCFQSNQFINIRFADNDVVKMGAGGETYGIQIKQDYYSSNYGDHGYLIPDGGFQRPGESIHQGKNLAARPQPEHQFEPAPFEQRLGYYRTR